VDETQHDVRVETVPDPQIINPRDAIIRVTSTANVPDKAKAAMGLATDRPHAPCQVILACRKGGHVSIPGVYGGMADKFPIGALMEKGLFVASGQTHVQKYTATLLQMILEDKLDTTFRISHHLPLEQAAHGYKIFKEEQNSVTKVVLHPGGVQEH
jgi:threonine dehydrogenase-like Zn-dependent dehydrogenase